jgi:hypothetical protein
MLRLFYKTTFFTSPPEGEARFSYSSSARLENLVGGKSTKNNTPLQDFVTRCKHRIANKIYPLPQGERERWGIYATRH